MSTSASSLAYARRQPGFTLVEVLIMVIILLVGVVAVIRIFPPGFEAINETQQASLAQQQVENILTGFEEHPESLPDAILPLDSSVWANNNLFSAVAFTCFPNDLTAVECSSTAGAWSWYGQHAYPHNSTWPLTQTWPLWQPLHTRIARRVIGEKVLIPSEITGTTAVNYAVLPKYIPRFGPLQTTDPYGAPRQNLIIYDQRYRKVGPDQFASLNAQTGLASPFYYRATYATTESEDAFYFPPFATGETVRDLRVVFSCMYLTGATITMQVSAPAAVLSMTTDGALSAINVAYAGLAVTPVVTVTNDYIKVQPTMTAGWQLVPGSEQLNRAYHYDTVNTPDALPTGHYYMDPGNEQLGDTLPTVIVFSKADTGRTVKIDYTVADWNILHEDVTVDDEGYVTLSFGAPKIRNKPNIPREPVTWGLYRPMRLNGNDVVLGLVDLLAGVPYHVRYTPGGSSQYLVDNVNSFPITNEVRLVDFDQSQSGRVRLGGVSGGQTDWHKLRGQSFRVYYRAQRDITMQVYRAPATFWFTSDRTHLEWDKFSLQKLDAIPTSGFFRNVVSLPSVHLGQSVAVDYAYWEDYGRSIDEPTGSWVPMQSISNLRTGRTYVVINSKVNPVTGLNNPVEHVGMYTVLNKDTVNKRVQVVPYLNTNAVSDIHAGAYFVIDNTIQSDAPLQKSYGEIHTITDLDAFGHAVITLRHLPSAKAHIAVRGVSVTVRALWTQPRRGYAYTLGQQPGALDWRGKWLDWNQITNTAVNYAPGQVTTWNGMTFRATAAGEANTDNQPGVGRNWMTYWERFPVLRPLNERWKAVSRTAVLSATRE